jgi:hypothetical protein
MRRFYTKINSKFDPGNFSVPKKRKFPGPFKEKHIGRHFWSDLPVRLKMPSEREFLGGALGPLAWLRFLRSK